MASTPISSEQWRKVMATDLDGVFFGCRAALPRLQTSGGATINTAAVSGTRGDWATSPYNAAKGAVVNLTRALALDLGKNGVRVNSVCPPLSPATMRFRDRCKCGRRWWRLRLERAAAARVAHDDPRSWTPAFAKSCSNQTDRAR